MGFRQLIQKLKLVTPSFLLFKITKTNGHFVGFHQLVQKLERLTPCRMLAIISSLQDKKNEWSLDWS